MNNPEIISKLKSNHLDPLSLYTLWNSKNQREWNETPDIFILIAKRALALGESLFAMDVLNEARLNWPDHIEIRTLLGFALARSGATQKANKILADLYENGFRDEEITGILARTHKDLWGISVEDEEKLYHLNRCLSLYAEAYETYKGYWSGINAATFSLLTGNKEQARLLASEVKQICLNKMAESDHTHGDYYWLLATLGEADLILGLMDEAKAWYQKASESHLGNYGSLASTRKNAGLLLTALKENDAMLSDWLPRPCVVVFTGHMIDSADRIPSRFPSDTESQVRLQIEKQIARLGAKIGFSSAACGSDIIFLEALLDIGGEINVVLPSPPKEFIKSSVELVQAGGWLKRFEKILQQAKSITIASDSCLSDLAYAYTNLMLLGLAELHAKNIDADLSALTVWDGNIGLFGGTGSAVKSWLECGQPVHSIHPITFQCTLLQPDNGDCIRPLSVSSLASAKPNTSHYQLVTMLFADVVGFSKLSETEISNFVQYYLGAIADLLDQVEYPPLARNVWGDGLYFVFSDISSAGNFALDLCSLVNSRDWSQYGLPDWLNIRIALHYGPAFRVTNPINKQTDFIGFHVSRAARIEPITPPGEVFASEAFAAISEASRVKAFTCEYAGKTALSKNYGIFPTYRVRRL